MATRSEVKVVRPFAGIDEADRPLDSVRLRVGGLEFEEGGVAVEEERLVKGDLQLALPTPEQVRQAVLATNVPSVDCALVVVGAAHTHRASRVYLQEYLRPGAWTETFFLDREEDDLVLNDRNGFTLTVAIVLMHDRVPEPLRPSLAGTWLARRTFKVGPEPALTGFMPEPLTDEACDRLRLPRDTCLYVHVEGVLEVAELSDAVQLYVNSEVLRALATDPSSVPATYLQSVMACEVVVATLGAIVREGREAGGPLDQLLDEHYVAASFVDGLARRVGIARDDLLSVAADSPERLRASVEVAFGVSKHAIQLLKKG